LAAASYSLPAFIHGSALSVPADLDLLTAQKPGEGRSGELRPLIRVENLRLALEPKSRSKAQRQKLSSRFLLSSQLNVAPATEMLLALASHMK